MHIIIFIIATGHFLQQDLPTTIVEDLSINLFIYIFPSFRLF